MNNKNYFKLKNIFCLVLKLDKGTQIEKCAIENTDKWDSLNHINLIMAIEEEFSLKINDEEINICKSFLDFQKLLIDKNVDFVSNND